MPNKVVKFMVKRESPTIFYFDVSEPSKITIDSWELNQGDNYTPTNIFVSANDEHDNGENYKWKTPVGVGKINIYPDRKDFELGTYRISV